MVRYLEKTYQTNSLKETYLFGEALALLLQANDVLALEGDLGSGKTTLTHGLAKGLKISSPISSPTFTLLFEHEPGERGIPLFHFDAYRLAGEAEWYDAGFMDYLDNEGLSVIEWPDRIKKVLPEDTIWLIIEKDLEKPNQRSFKLKLPQSLAYSLDSLRKWEIS